MNTNTPKIFIDTSLIVAFIDRTDLNHQKAIEVFEHLAKHQYQVYTSSLTFFQTFNRLERSLGTAISQDFMQAMLDSSIQILYPQENDLITCQHFYSMQGNRSSLTDIMNAHLMEKHEIHQILTFDSWADLLGTRLSSLLTPQVSQTAI